MTFDKHQLIYTDALLEAVDAFLTKENPSLIALDTETNGLVFWRNPIIGVSFSLNSKEGFYIPLLSWKPDESIKKTSKKEGIVQEYYPDGNLVNIWTGEAYPEDVQTKDVKYPEHDVAYMRKWF